MIKVVDFNKISLKELQNIISKKDGSYFYDEINLAKSVTNIIELLSDLNSNYTYEFIKKIEQHNGLLCHFILNCCVDMKYEHNLFCFRVGLSFHLFEKNPIINVDRIRLVKTLIDDSYLFNINDSLILKSLTNILNTIDNLSDFNFLKNSKIKEKLILEFFNSCDTFKVNTCYSKINIKNVHVHKILDSKNN